MNHAPIVPPELLKHLESLSTDAMDIFTLEEDTVRGAILNASYLVNAMRANHGLGILESIALGHGYMGALLCTMMLKGTDRLRYEITCDGPMAGMSVDANAQGQVRGYLQEPVFRIDSPIESFSLEPFIGSGSQSLVRFPEGFSEGVRGTSHLAHGSIADSLAAHFRESEQTHTAFALSIHFNTQGQIVGAGGLFLQAMPGASETILEDLELWLPQLPGLGKALSEGQTTASYLHDHLGAFGPRLLGSRAVEFQCTCSRENFVRYFRSLDLDRRRELASAGPMPMEVLCHNCCSRYQLYEEDLGI